MELLAGVMVGKCGIKKGDAVLMYFPVIPQCLIAMLACTRIGAIYSLVYGGFPPKPISTRIQHTEVINFHFISISILELINFHF